MDLPTPIYNFAISLSIENDYILPMSPEEKAIIDSNYDEIVVENYDYNHFDYNNHHR